MAPPDLQAKIQSPEPELHGLLCSRCPGLPIASPLCSKGAPNEQCLSHSKQLRNEMEYGGQIESLLLRKCMLELLAYCERLRSLLTGSQNGAAQFQAVLEGDRHPRWKGREFVYMLFPVSLPQALLPPSTAPVLTLHPCPLLYNSVATTPVAEHLTGSVLIVYQLKNKTCI